MARSVDRAQPPRAVRAGGSDNTDTEKCAGFSSIIRAHSVGEEKILADAVCSDNAAGLRGYKG
jgi:hypothetical protein